MTSEKIKYFRDENGLTAFNVRTLKVFRFRSDLKNILPQILPEDYTEEHKEAFIDSTNRIENENFRKLYDNGVTTYQITFDGAKESHDTTRKLKDGSGGSYDTIIDNIRQIKESAEDDMKFEVVIRVNFMKNTYSTIYGLIDDLVELIGRDKRFNIYTRPVYNFHTCRNDIDKISDNIFTIEEGLKVQMNFTLYIQKKLCRYDAIKSLTSYMPLPASRWCGEDSNSNMIVGYDGSIYFCDTLIGDEQFCIGRLENNGTITYTEKSSKWRKSVFEMDTMSECLKCKCLPTCMGGCKRERVYLGKAKPCLYTEHDILKFMQMYYKTEYAAK